MPAPKMPCGFPPYPDCPPIDALKKITKGDIVRAYRALSPEDVAEAEAEIADEDALDQ